MTSSKDEPTMAQVNEKLIQLARSMQRQVHAAKTLGEDSVTWTLDLPTAEALAMALAAIPDLLQTTRNNAALVVTLVARYTGHKTVIMPSEIMAWMLSYLNGDLALTIHDNPVSLGKELEVIKAPKEDTK